MPTYAVTIRIPTGPLTIKSDQYNIFEISHTSSGKNRLAFAPPPIKECIRQLEEYFCKQRKTFNLNLKVIGTPFQKKVWSALQTIPYGKVISYSQVASIINAPRACRAVGGANNANPFSIVIPCHRVVGIKNDLVGYGGGLEKKSILLEHEGLCIKNLKVR